MNLKKARENLIKIKKRPKNKAFPIMCANLSGEQVCKTIEKIQEKFHNIDGVLEGEVSYGQASTIVYCTSDEIKIIRQGPICIEEMNRVQNSR